FPFWSSSHFVPQKSAIPVPLPLLVPSLLLCVFGIRRSRLEGPRWDLNPHSEKKKETQRGKRRGGFSSSFFFFSFLVFFLLFFSFSFSFLKRRRDWNYTRMNTNYWNEEEESTQINWS